jgi:hypothetical protein
MRKTMHRRPLNLVKCDNCGGWHPEDKPRYSSIPDMDCLLQNPYLARGHVEMLAQSRRAGITMGTGWYDDGYRDLTLEEACAKYGYDLDAVKTRFGLT